MKRFAFDRGGLLGIAVLVTYVWLAPAYIVDGDNAELSTLGTIGGVAHPTGYPLYLLWLRATSWIPGHSAAHTASIATAILGAAAIVVLHAACRAWGARPPAATIAVAMFAASPFILRIHTETEVFALNDLVAATILWLAATGGPLRGAWRAGALGLVAGLGLSDHVTCVLLAPVGILGAVRGVREADSKLGASGLAVAGLVVGLTPYAYLAITEENPLSWGRHIDSFGAVLDHFLRKDYGGPGAFAPSPDAASTTDNLIALARMLGRTWLWAPLAIGAAALGHRLVRPAAGESRTAWWMLAASFMLAGPLLASRFDVTLEGPGLFIVQRFFVLPSLLLAIPCAVGLDQIALHARERISLRIPFANALAVVLFAAIAMTSLPYVQDQHSPALERGVSNMLHSLPRGAVAIVHDDDLDFGSGYLQLIQGERPDVTVVMWTAMGLPVYRERVERRLGIEFPPGGPEGRTVWFAKTVLARGHEVFVDPYQEYILAALPNYPHGILFRVVPREETRPSIAEIFAINKALYAQFDLHYPLPTADSDWPRHVHERYVRMWQIIRNELSAAGLKNEAAMADEMAWGLLPKR